MMFYPANIIHKLLRYMKTLVDSKQHKGVYKISCSHDKSYIGESGHTIQVRIIEYEVDIHHNCIDSSTFVKHCHTKKHPICLEDTWVITKILDYLSNKCLKEVLKIEKKPIII